MSAEIVDLSAVRKAAGGRLATIPVVVGKANGITLRSGDRWNLIEAEFDQHGDFLEVALPPVQSDYGRFVQVFDRAADLWDRIPITDPLIKAARELIERTAL